MRNRGIAVSLLNLRNLKTAYIITAVCFILMTIISVVQLIQGRGEYFEKSYLVSSGNMLYIIILCSPIIISVVNFIRTMHIGGRKEDFLTGAFLTYIILSAAVSLINLMVYAFVDSDWANTFQVINLAAVFGWTDNGIFIAFLQQFAFLLLISAFVHTLSAIQGIKSAWLIDIFLIVTFTAFIAVPILRSVLFTVIRLTTLWPLAWVQIISCIIIVVALYVVNRPILNSKMML